MQKITDKIASTHLGKKVDGSSYYDPSLLVAVPRIENRKQYNIDSDNLPFEGYDVWHAYEFSCLTEKGLPVTKVLKLKYNCTSEFIIESKSLKLYLNSFNMTKLGNNTQECLETCKETISNDLSEVLKTPVSVNFLDDSVKITNIFENFKNIVDFVDETNLIVDKFKEAPEILETEICSEKRYYLKFSSLRSNCRVTHQPDFGDVFIYYKSQKHIKEETLVKYLCSFRSEFHFHEECCEMIYKRLSDILNKKDELFVCALYTRRGGIDICPTRKNCIMEDSNILVDLNKLARNGIKQ